MIVSTLGWISTLRGLIVPVLFSAFATFLFRQFFLGFPHELEEAASIDGAGYRRTFWRTVQVALSQFMSSQKIDMPQLFVGAAVAILPVLLVFLFLQRYLLQGVDRSGID